MIKIYLSLLILLLLRIFTSDLNTKALVLIPAAPLRERIEGIYQEVLPYNQSNLLSGVVLGNINIDSNFKNKIAAVGLSHVIAASGMNLTLFSGFGLWLTGLFRWSRIYKVILQLVFVLFYMTITGFAPPIVRAGLMILGRFSGEMAGRQNGSVAGLLTAAYIMLWVSPSLVTSASFLLSFSAMMSQIFLSSLINQSPVGKNFITQLLLLVRENFYQSFLATLFTFPIVVYFFSKFSLISLGSNMLTLWTVEPLMILGGLMAGLGMISINLARIISLPASALLTYFLWVVDYLGKDIFLFKFKLASPIFVVGYYLTLGGFVWWWTRLRTGGNIHRE